MGVSRVSLDRLALLREIPSGASKSRGFCRGSKPPADALARGGNAEGGEKAGEDIHGVMGAQNDDGCYFEKDKKNRAGGEPRLVKPGELSRPEDGDGGVAAEEEIVGDAVGHEQRGEAGIAPNHSWRRRQRAQRLHDLAQDQQHR